MSISAACQDKLEAAGVRGDQFEFIAQWIATREFKRVKEGPEAMAAFDVAAAKAWTAWEAGSKTADQDLKDAAGDKAKVFLKVVGNSFAGKGPPGFDEATCKQNWQVFACTCNTLALGAAPSPAGCTTSYPEYDCAMPMPGKSCKSSSSWGVWAALAIGLGVFVGSYALVTRGSGSGKDKRNPSEFGILPPSRDYTRARKIVVLASKKTKNKAIKAWLQWDEYGKWEKQALDMLEKTEARAQELHVSSDQVDDEIATYLAYLAAEATLRDANKRRIR